VGDSCPGSGEGARRQVQGEEVRCGGSKSGCAVGDEKAKKRDLKNKRDPRGGKIVQRGLGEKKKRRRKGEYPLTFQNLDHVWVIKRLRIASAFAASPAQKPPGEGRTTERKKTKNICYSSPKKPEENKTTTPEGEPQSSPQNVDPITQKAGAASKPRPRGRWRSTRNKKPVKK